MAKGQLDVILHHLLRPFHDEEVANFTDAQLLERFLHARDAGAFTSLVHRHGAMVLAVAVRVLNDEHEAEDVFQAAFLVLARRARSIRRKKALGAWLYQVAYHLAIRARAEKAQRRVQERQMQTIQKVASIIEVEEIELRDALQRELSRLPEKYRLPIVLHYLEGRTKNETAEQLGWREGTVSGRLARARDLLRHRLIRRGFVLSSSGVAATLIESISTAAAPPGLVNATVHAALTFGQGAAVQGAVSASAARLAEAIMKKMIFANARVCLSVVFAVSVLAVSAAACRWLANETGGKGLDVGEVERTQQAGQVGNKESAVGRQPVSDEQRKGEIVRLSASGRVVDEKGRPVENAAVYLREMAFMREQYRGLKKGYTDILAQVTTGSQGQFDFTDVAAESMNIPATNKYRRPWNLVVSAKGYGLSWHWFKSSAEGDVTLMLRPEAPLHGHLIDDKGRPAAGVRVRVVGIYDQIDPESNSSGLLFLNLDHSQLPVATVTDSAGRFVIAGLPRDYGIELLAMDPRFTAKVLSCATIDEKEIERLNARASVSPEWKLLADGFTANLRPSEQIRGRVVCGDTRAPAVGVRVSMGSYRSVTDREGRYSLERLDQPRYFLHIEPPPEANYFPILSDWIKQEDPATWRHDFVLERGSVLTGQLREEETGQPIRVANVPVWYTYLKKEPGYGNCQTLTRDDGTFRIVVPPGKGKLLTPSSLPGYASPEVMTDFGPKPAGLPIEIKPGETLTDKDIFFSKGTVVQGRILDPDGQPLAAAKFEGDPEQSPSDADGRFVLRGLSQLEGSRFLIVHPGRRLGGVLIVKGSKSTNPVIVDVKLKPTQSVRACVVDERGDPVANKDIFLRIGLSHEGREPVSLPLHGPVHTDGSGKFTFSSLLVDSSYTVMLLASGYTGVLSRFVVETGKAPEIPDLTLLSTRLAVTGIIVDGAGNPVEGVEVKILPRFEPSDFHLSLRTKKDGQFEFHRVARGTYRLIATLWRETGEIDKNGRFVNENEAQTELQVTAGEANVRVSLDVAKPTKR
ncbi:MAG TPA: sigma-70 family RNA polymerase sigma factor [Gemmataceae bacterium]|nr:sigma-70 family RNA polymerase sigma factor [Gemmataceae bacterium]